MATKSVKANQPTIFKRVVNSREPLAAILTDNRGTPIDLTGKTIVFRLVSRVTADSAGGTVVVNNGSTTTLSATEGTVAYYPGSSDLATAGEYAMYFVDTTSTPNRKWPHDGDRWILVVEPEQGVID